MESFKASSSRMLTSRGILLALDVFSLGECMALPIDKQESLGGDFDGDQLLVI